MLEGQPDDANVFRNVKVLGLKSQNGYSYDAKAVEKAAPLYESAPVFVDHAKGNRSYADRIGYITNPRIQESELYGDFTLNPKHALAEQVKWDAEHGTSGVGFSHSVDGHLNKKTHIVESISKVFSVDLCASCATTNSLYESVIKEENDIDELKSAVAALAAEVAELKVSMAEMKPAAEQAKQQIATLSESLNKAKNKPVAVMPTPEPVKDGYQEFLKTIKAKD